ncbi:DNA-binding protein [Sulfurimonas sp. CVO]|uniref:helix-turn-helix domain-containing protein n=1 Tax=Sulfurimonas sp. CVO TaxID=2283483 RepID=UPI00132E9BD5|nr:helix-turn-helix domain-containing protein [Sulfurimonas sp. CVO]QHG91175.1 DNA-binding protein [Sulfurimonas sp. CVO]
MNVEFENINLIKQISNDMQLLKKLLVDTSVKRWLSVKELAIYLSYSKDRIYKIKDTTFIEGIHFYKKSGKILFDRVAIDEWVISKETTNEINQSQRQAVDNILSSIKKI